MDTNNALNELKDYLNAISPSLLDISSHSFISLIEESEKVEVMNKFLNNQDLSVLWIAASPLNESKILLIAI